MYKVDIPSALNSLQKCLQIIFVYFSVMNKPTTICTMLQNCLWMKSTLISQKNLCGVINHVFFEYLLAKGPLKFLSLVV